MSARLPRVTARQAIAALKRDGWIEVRQVGSHVRLRHPDRNEDVTVAMHAGTMPVGTFKRLLNQAGLTVERFKELL